MSELIYRVTALVLYVAYMLVRNVSEAKLKRGSKFEGLANAEKSDRLELWVVGFGSVPVWVYMLSPWLDFAAMGLPDALRWLGVMVALFGTYVFWWSHHTLAENWTPFIEAPPGARLITGGPYRWVRHPMYSSFLLFNGGLWLVSSNWIAGGFAFLSFLWMYLHRVGREERMMVELFGDEYRAFAEKTGRVIPGIGRGLKDAPPS